MNLQQIPQEYIIIMYVTHVGQIQTLNLIRVIGTGVPSIKEHPNNMNAKNK
jgi:hypothetical protein